MKDDERSHSRISFYAVFRDWGKPIYISTFLKLRRADDWIEGYQYYERIVGFIAKIDGIEYHINKNGDTQTLIFVPSGSSTPNSASTARGSATALER